MVLAAGVVEQYAPGGVAIMAVAIASAIALRWLVPAIDQQSYNAKEAERRSEICDYRLGVVIDTLIGEGIPVPQEARSGVPPHLRGKDRV